MIKNSLIIVLFIGLIVSLLSTLVTSKLNKSLQKDSIKLKNELNSLEYESSINKNKYNKNLFSENKHVSNIQLLNANSDTVFLKSLMDNTKLIYLFSENTCVSCVEDELEIVRNLGDSIGASNIFIISDFDKINRLRAIVIRKRIESPFFISKERFGLPMEEDDKELPSFFLLNKELKAQFIFKTGGDQSIYDPYYTRIINFFKTGS